MKKRKTFTSSKAEPLAVVFSVRTAEETVNKIKDYAYTKRINVGEALSIIVDEFVAEYNSNISNEPILKHDKGGNDV